MSEVVIYGITTEMGMVVNTARWWVTVHYLDCPRYRDRRRRHDRDLLPAGIPIRMCRRCRPLITQDPSELVEDIAWKTASR